LLKEVALRFIRKMALSLFKHADIAMHRAKDMGINNYQLMTDVGLAVGILNDLKSIVASIIFWRITCTYR